MTRKCPLLRYAILSGINLCANQKKLITGTYRVSLIILLLFAPGILAAQSNSSVNYNLKQMIPTSPEAALLGRFGEVPIGYYTGTADISIPLYTIKEDGIEIPITLSYHSSGIRVEDQATNVGLGWLLEPGGAIIQIVNGAQDGSGNDSFIGGNPEEYAMLKNHVSLPENHGARAEIGSSSWPCYWSQSQPNQDWFTPMQILQTLSPLQPDIYQYNFPGGYSGKFYIDPEKNRIVLLDKKQQITFQHTGPPNAWMATTLDGNKYYFDTQETSTDGAGHTGTTFKLSQIVLHNGKTINFSYVNTTYFWDGSYSETYHTPYERAQLESSNEMQIQSSDVNINYSIQTVSQIRTKDVIINFNQGTRQDMQAPSITSVDIIDPQSNKKLKTFSFNYGYFDYSQVGSSHVTTNETTLDLYGKRLKLTSIQETGYDPVSGQAKQNPPYQFTYNESVLMPLKSSFAKDFWGYYNGINNTNLMPDMIYPYDSGMIGQNYPINMYYLGYIPHGANRATDTSKLSANMLTKIVYPTGGSTQFAYESNSFSNANYPDVNKMANTFNAVNAEDQNATGDPTTVNFTVPRELTLYITVNFGKGVPQNTVTASQMQTAYVNLNKIVSGVTTTVKQWTMTSTTLQNQFNANGYVTINDTYDFGYDPNTSYQLVASMPDNLGNQKVDTKEASVTGTINYYNVPNYNLSYGGGVRIKSIKNYDINGKLSSNKALKYINTDGTSSGILMSPLMLAYYRYLLEVYQDPSMGRLSTTENIWYQSSESSIPFSNAAQGNLVGYSRVEETELSANSPTNGKHVYNYHNQASETGVNTPDNPDLQNGLLTFDQIYDSAGKLKVENDYSYTSLKDSTFTGYKVFYNVIANCDCGEMDGAEDEVKDGWIDTNAFRLYNILNYPLNSHWYVQSSKTTKLYDGTSPFTTNEYHRYNAIGQLIQDSTVNSKNQILLTKYVYPYDKYGTSAMAHQLVDSAFYNNILEQHTYNNGAETSQVKVAYGLVNGQLVRDTLSKSYNGGALYTDAIFNAYGPNKTLKQVREKGVQASSFLYDQNNSYLLAEVSNAALRDIAYSSFELNQAGNWTIGSALRDTLHAFSGKSSYVLSNGSLSKSGLTSATYYIVSYWTMSGSAYTISGTQTGYPVKGPTINGWTYYEHLVKGVTSVIISGSGNIDEVRLYPKDAQMKTYTYIPMVGISSVVSEKNEPNYYEYDAFQRLINIKDQYGNIRKHIDYHYQGQ